jgi:predicted CoA-binding protein
MKSQSLSEIRARVCQIIQKPQKNALSTRSSLQPIGSFEVESLSKDSAKEILTKYKTVAVVGLSRDPSKESHRVAEYLKSQGFSIVPVNPTPDEILGEKSYRSLLDIPPEIQRTLDIIDIFRPSADVPPIIEDAVKLKEQHDRPYVVWMQLGIINEQAATTARAAGLTVVMNRCMMVEHKKLFPNY